MGRKRRITWLELLLQIPFIAYSATILVICFLLVFTPFRSTADLARGILVSPNSFTFDNFADAWRNGLGIAIKNSMTLSLLTCLFTALLGGFAGYAFSFLRFRLRNGLYIFMYSGIYVSTMLIALPLFLQYRQLGLVNSMFGALLIFLGLRLPFSVYLFKNFFDEFSIELIEAARIDGLADLRIFFWIVMPLSVGVLSTVILFNFTAVWSDYLIGLLFLQKDSLMTIMPRIMNIFGSGPMVTQATPLGQGFAGLLVSTIPIIVIYALAKKHYITGLTLGSVKS
ncbi:MAG: carbohydrate ABC transporter permease [Spirochaetota bacterium]